MDQPYRAAPDVYVLPTHLPIPGVGNLLVNSFVLLAEEPVLIDTGLGLDGPDFVAALESVIPPGDLRWIWLTHDDADHTGGVQKVMELAPRARLATHAFSALRMATWWPVPLDRVHALTLDDRLRVGDRTLQAVRPPLFDNPLSVGVYDESGGTLFSVDSFGAILSEVTQDASEIPEADLAQGMVVWGTFDSPWTHLVQRDRFEAVLDRVRRLDPQRVLSSHLPAVRGGVDALLEVLGSIPDAEPFVPPDQAAFDQMLQQITAPGPS
jgi:glyoxylase-like metal-dependent hydrolase (beta-lactamase superfamily II)